MRVGLWPFVFLCTVSCAHLALDGGSNLPKGPLRVEVGGMDSSGSGVCEFFLAPPEGSEWRIHPSRWGAVSVELRFSRRRDKDPMRHENIYVSTVADTLLPDTSQVDEGWVRNLVGDAYAWSGFSDLKLTPETSDRVVLDGLELHVVRFSGSYRILMAPKPTFERAIAYLVRSPCHTWRGWVVFRLVDSNYGGIPDDTFPSPVGSAVLRGMIRSLVGGRGTRSEL